MAFVKCGTLRKCHCGQVTGAIAGNFTRAERPSGDRAYGGGASLISRICTGCCSVSTFGSIGVRGVDIFGRTRRRYILVGRTCATRITGTASRAHGAVRLLLTGGVRAGWLIRSRSDIAVFASVEPFAV